MKSAEIMFHQFGGCENLLSHYRVVGSALCNFEEVRRNYRLSNQIAVSQFQQDVSFVGTEVLESYLEDLLDSSVEEEKLFIKKSLKESLFLGVSNGVITGAIMAVVIVLSAILSSRASSPIFVALLSLIISSSICLFWQLLPHKFLRRRMTFARVLSREISRRRGRGSVVGIRNSIDTYLPKTSKASVAGVARFLN